MAPSNIKKIFFAPKVAVKGWKLLNKGKSEPQVAPRAFLFRTVWLQPAFRKFPCTGLQIRAILLIWSKWSFECCLWWNHWFRFQLVMWKSFKEVNFIHMCFVVSSLSSCILISSFWSSESELCGPPPPPPPPSQPGQSRTVEGLFKSGKNVWGWDGITSFVSSRTWIWLQKHLTENKQQVGAVGRLGSRGEILDVSKVELNRMKFQAVKQSPCTAYLTFKILYSFS